MLNHIKEFLLNTPKKYWFIIHGYHIHKSSAGVLLLILGTILMITHNPAIGLLLIVIGCIILALSIIGQKYTHGKYKLELWEKYSRK